MNQHPGQRPRMPLSNPLGPPEHPLPITIEEEGEEEENIHERIEGEARRQVEEEEDGSDDESEEERGQAEDGAGQVKL